MAMEYKQCCLKCKFHFFDEDECPNCWAERVVKEDQAEWDRQLLLLEMASGISSNDDFWSLWYSKNNETENWFKNLCRDLAPEIYAWYLSLDKEREYEGCFEPNKQMDLFEPELPF